MDKYIPLGLGILLTVGGYYVERSFYSPGLPGMEGYRWLSYALSGFVFLLWLIAMFVTVVTYKDLQEVQIISSSTRIIKLTD